MINILIVEDDDALAQLFESVLKMQNYNTYIANNGLEAFDILESVTVDIIISDLMMPKMDGFMLLEDIRKFGYNIPILVISAKAALSDKKRGFRLGVDDYMVKPIDVEEMVWRVKAILKRYKLYQSDKLCFGETELDYSTFSLKQGNELIELPSKEFQLLFKLLTNSGRIFTRQQLMDDIWGIDTDTDERTIDVHIKRLRNKFKNNNDFEIVTIRGLGYKAVKIDEK